MTTTYHRWIVSRSTLPYAEWAELHPREDRAPERSVAIAWVPRTVADRRLLEDPHDR